MAVYGKTFAQLREDVRLMLHDDDAFSQYGEGSATIINDAINRALVQIAMDLKYKRILASYTVITGATDFLLSTVLGGTDDFMFCEWVKVGALDSEPYSQEDYWYVKTHEEDVFCINNEYLVFGDTIAAAKIIRLYYIPLPQTYVNGTGNPTAVTLVNNADVPDLRVQYLHLVKYKACQIIFFDSHEWEQAKVADELYGREMIRCRAFKQQVQDGHSLVEPEDMFSK